MTKRKETEVGTIDAQFAVVVRREIEVGVAWEAEAVGLNQAATGATPYEAVRGLFKALSDRGLGFRASASDSVLAKLARDTSEKPA